MSKPTADELERQLRPLWLGAQAGDEVAYREALMLFAGRLRGYFRRRLSSDPHDVEDLVQETLLALHLQRGTYDDSVPVTAWLHGIARHKLIDQLRRRGRSAQLFEAMDDLPDAMHPVCDTETTAGRDLKLLLDTLPAAQQQAILDTKLEGLSVAEAALRQGVSESAVKVHVHRGLKRLAKLVSGKS
jgi:RNA polymerase sigma-70 factor, ECF subfamily